MDGDDDHGGAGAGDINIVIMVAVGAARGGRLMYFAHGSNLLKTLTTTLPTSP